MAARALRWTGAVVLLLVAALLITAAVVARYARSELLDTDAYVETVTPLASDPAVQNAITTRVTDELVAAIDVPKLAQDLAQQLNQVTNAPRADQIAGAVAGPINDWLTWNVPLVICLARRPQLVPPLRRSARASTGRGHEVIRRCGAPSTDGVPA